mmetsp:Transcript_37597/g.78016  ORF Transcript_37597/g.78016 Transcript_37597/m.78016 type:complete len:91 (-) Transcript_37597:958-1230(-)
MYSFLRRHGALILLVAFMYHELWENTHLQVLSQQEEPRQSSFHNVSSIVVCNSNSDSNNNHSSASTKKTTFFSLDMAPVGIASASPTARL